MPPPKRYKLKVEVPPLGSAPAVEFEVDAASASLNNRAHIDGLHSGVTYAVRLAAALPQIQAPPGSAASWSGAPPLRRWPRLSETSVRNSSTSLKLAVPYLVGVGVRVRVRVALRLGLGLGLGLGPGL